MNPVQQVLAARIEALACVERVKFHTLTRRHYVTLKGGWTRDPSVAAANIYLRARSLVVVIHAPLSIAAMQSLHDLKTWACDNGTVSRQMSGWIAALRAQ